MSCAEMLRGWFDVAQLRGLHADRDGDYGCVNRLTNDKHIPSFIMYLRVFWLTSWIFTCFILISYLRTLNVTSLGPDVVLKKQAAWRKVDVCWGNRRKPRVVVQPPSPSNPTAVVPPLSLPSMAAFNPAFRNAASRPKQTEVLPWMAWACLSRTPSKFCSGACHANTFGSRTISL